MRELTSFELALVSGGFGGCDEATGDELIVCNSLPPPTLPSYPPSVPLPPSWTPPSDSPPSSGVNPPPPAEPPCGASNPATIETAKGTVYSGLDGAKYYVPQAINNEYINNAASYLMEIRANGIPGQIYSELYSMYTDTSHPHFLDFKEYGTSSLPGTPEAGNQTYYSQAAGAWVTTSYFEPYGNVIYGFMMTVAGYSAEETWLVAAAMQEGNSGFGDDPQDQPHVNLGITIGQQYLATGGYHAIKIDSSNC